MAAASASSALILGSSPKTSSPTGAAAIAARISDVGCVMVSLRKSSRGAASTSRAAASGETVEAMVSRSVAAPAPANATSSNARDLIPSYVTVSLPLAVPSPRAVAAASKAIWVLIGGLLGLYLVVFAASALGRVLRSHEEFVYGESWLLDDARRIATGEALYPPVDRLPLMHTAYTPIYYVLVGELQRLFGDSGYTLGRIVSLLAAALATGAIAWSVRRLTGGWLFGALAAGLFLTQNLTVLLWAPMHRVDILALCITLL